MSQPSQHLQYAPVTPVTRAARARRWALPVALGLLIVGAVAIAPRLIRYTQALHFQRQCLTYAAPGTQVVLETNPAEAKKLIADPRYATDPSGAVAYLVPGEWTSFYASLGSGFQTSGTVFLHERSLPNGTRLLVGVDVNLVSLLHTPRTAAAMSARILEPGSAFRGPRMTMTATRGDGSQIQFDPAADRLTIFAGQPDPSDASHFTIDYDLNGVRHTLDGWVVDANEIKIESRD